jgi:hypothetical protein
MLLPLDSPHWNGLTACYSARRAIELLRRIVSTRRLGTEWEELRDEIIHQGSVYGVTSAALPHLIRLAPSLPPDEQRDLWIEVGFLITAGANSFHGNEPVPGMQETLTQSLRDAEPLALQAFLTSPSLDEGEVSYYALACVALSGHTVGDAIWEFLAPGNGYIRLKCPECDAEYEVDGFGDPVLPSCVPPPVPALVSRARPEWARVPISLPPGFEGFSAVARSVADAGLPGQASAAAVWCLVAAMVAAKGAQSWARTLLRLTGHFHCSKCGSVRPVAAMFDHSLATSTGSSSAPSSAGLPATASPDLADPDPATVADEAGFKPAPGGSVIAGQIALRPVPVPAHLVIPVLCEALVKMPGGPDDARMLGEARVPWLAKLWDGRMLLATGHADGSVHLRDPSSRSSLNKLWRREGQPVTGMTFGFDEDLVVVYGSLDVDVWSPRAVSGERSSMAPKPEYLHAHGHRHIVAVCSATGLSYRKPMLLADRNGTVSMWETFGVRLGDPLSPDPRHREVFAIAASAGFVVTASLADANLRIWQPLSSIVSLLPLESVPQWLTFTGDILTVGLTTGPVSFSVR